MLLKTTSTSPVQEYLYRKQQSEQYARQQDKPSVFTVNAQTSLLLKGNRPHYHVSYGNISGSIGGNVLNELGNSNDLKTVWIFVSPAE